MERKNLHFGEDCYLTVVTKELQEKDFRRIDVLYVLCTAASPYCNCTVQYVLVSSLFTLSVSIVTASYIISP
jgi:hypothetical protein